MRSHPYLRAYMAGILLPSWVLLLVLGIFLLSHFSQRLPSGIESAIVFPMAIVPNLWGLWNVLYMGFELRGRPCARVSARPAFLCRAAGGGDPSGGDGHLLSGLEICGGVL